MFESVCVCVCACVCQCLLFVGNKTLTTMGEDKWSKRKNCPSFTVFALPPRISSSHLFFLAFYFPITTSTTCTAAPVQVFFRTLTRAYPLHHFAICIYSRIYGRWLMMSIFHLSVCANFCFSQQFTLDSPLDRTCENEIIIIVLRGACRLMYACVYIYFFFHLLKRMGTWF